jgi:hypothetical protein
MTEISPPPPLPMGEGSVLHFHHSCLHTGVRTCHQMGVSARRRG